MDIEMELEFLPLPGETLEEVLETHNVTKEQLASDTGFSVDYIQGVIAGDNAISEPFAEALESALHLEGTKTFWINLQAGYERDYESITGYPRQYEH